MDDVPVSTSNPSPFAKIEVVGLFRRPAPRRQQLSHNAYSYTAQTPQWG